MKTTIEIADPALEQARRPASRQQTTLKALVEQGLRLVIASSGRSDASFRLRKASFKGAGAAAVAARRRLRAPARAGVRGPWRHVIAVDTHLLVDA